jgi:hypothetical protein
MPIFLLSHIKDDRGSGGNDAQLIECQNSINTFWKISITNRPKSLVMVLNQVNERITNNKNILMTNKN